MDAVRTDDVVPDEERCALHEKSGKYQLEK
jgi:hypothetical protein